MSTALPDPRKAKVFGFTSSHYDPASGEMRLCYAYDDGPELTERLHFPYAPWPDDPNRQLAFMQALEILHLLAGVSYYKAGLPPAIECDGLPPDTQQAEFLQKVYQQGLAEFAHRNGLDLEGRISFPSDADLQAAASEAVLPERALVAMGGGKDSLVSLELLREAGVEIQPFAVGASPLIAETARAARLPLITIGRELAPELAAMNSAGAWNGHVPVTAINSAIGMCAALLYGYRWVVFSNERSAEEETLTDAAGKPVNHQYSKSFEFEQGFRSIISRQVASGLEYFSLLRPLGELAVAERFSALRRYHGVFSSCNRNFHRDGSHIEGRWCGDCPKCRFTSLALAPFMAPGELAEIVGSNLLDDPRQEDGYRELCALGRSKPFECVGTVAESRAALVALTGDEQWSTCHIVQQLAPALPPDGPVLSDLLEPAGPHCIPPEIFSRVAV